MRNAIFKWIKEFWMYLGETQSKWTRIIHLILVLLIIFQLVDSNFMEVKYSPIALLNWGAWMHIYSGIFITLVSIAFIWIIFKKRGFKYFFPYLYKEFSQIKLDLKTLANLQLPEASAFGIAAIVQGLGIAALILVLVSGLFWFASWMFQWGFAPYIQETHEVLTGLIEIYIIGHGCLGVLHFLFKKFLPKYVCNSNN